MLVGITGAAGSGKSSIASVLEREHGFVAVGLADVMKRFCADIFQWSDERLFGASSLRNELDPTWNGLSARSALQELGTGFGRRMHPDVWIRYVGHVAEALANGGFLYDARHGLAIAPDAKPAHVVVSDIRFHNEAASVRAGGGVIWRATRGQGLRGAHGLHQSEIEQQTIEADHVIDNNRPIEELSGQIGAAMMKGRAA